MAKVIKCDCGFIVRGGSDDELLAAADAHMRDAHPEMAGKVGRDDLLAMAEDVD